MLIFFNPNCIGVKYSLIELRRGEVEPCLCFELLFGQKAVSNRDIFYQSSVRTRALFTKLCVAWLNMPPHPSIQLGFMIFCSNIGECWLNDFLVNDACYWKKIRIKMVINLLCVRSVGTAAVCAGVAPPQLPSLQLRAPRRLYR